MPQMRRKNGSLPRLNCPDKESYYALQYSHPEWLVRLLPSSTARS